MKFKKGDIVFEVSQGYCLIHIRKIRIREVHENSDGRKWNNYYVSTRGEITFREENLAGTIEEAKEIALKFLEKYKESTLKSIEEPPYEAITPYPHAGGHCYISHCCKAESSLHFREIGNCPTCGQHCEFLVLEDANNDGFTTGL